MRLSAFINERMDDILAEWDRYALTMTPAADHMSLRRLRDHSESMLREIARDLGSSQTAKEQQKKSQGTEDNSVSSPAAKHGLGRYADQFTLLQLSAEFRALRATVLRLWLPIVKENTADTLDDVVRFNEAIDQAFAESVVTYSSRTEQTRDMYDAILGHDLRGPLATMTAAGVLLAHPMPEGGLARIAGNVARSARFMTAMVDDLLALSSIKLSKGIQIKPVPVDVAALCRAAVVDATAMHPLSRYELACAGRMDACLDPVRIHQLLVNLLGNAAQHGTEGQPVQVDVGGSDTEVCISVSNKGERMRDDALDAIFDPLIQLKRNEHDSTSQQTSLGLGLHIAREIATAHSGTLVATSTDLCTTFSVHLPREHAASEQARS